MTVMLAAEMVAHERVRLNESMAKHTSWQVGGPAEQFFQPLDLADLCSYLRQSPTASPRRSGWVWVVTSWSGMAASRAW